MDAIRAPHVQFDAGVRERGGGGCFLRSFFARIAARAIHRRCAEPARKRCQAGGRVAVDERQRRVALGESRAHLL